MTEPLHEYKGGRTLTHLYRRTGASHTGMLSTGLSLYLSTRPAIPAHAGNPEYRIQAHPSTADT
jgi:hypothetical protein